MRDIEFYEGGTILAAEALGVDVSNLVQPEISRYVTIDVTYTNGTTANIGGTRFLQEGGSITAFLFPESTGGMCGPLHESASLVFDDVAYQEQVSKLQKAHKRLEALLSEDLAAKFFVLNMADKSQNPYVRNVVFKMAKDMACGGGVAAITAAYPKAYQYFLEIRNATLDDPDQVEID